MAKRKFLVVGQITISVSTDVMATSADEAKSIAMERPIMSLCNQCATGSPEDEWVTSGELDGGDPDNVTVMEDDDL
jgi:hypothetical protein